MNWKPEGVTGTVHLEKAFAAPGQFTLRFDGRMQGLHLSATASLPLDMDSSEQVISKLDGVIRRVATKVPASRKSL
jgi:hypothetical protein